MSHLRIPAADIRAAAQKLRFALRHGWIAMAARQVEIIETAALENQTENSVQIEIELASAQDTLADFWRELEEREEIALDLARVC